MSPKEREDIDCVYGHYAWPLVDEVRNDKRFVSILRNSEDRIISWIKHVDRVTDHPQHSKIAEGLLTLDTIKAQDLKDLDNGQLRLLGGLFDVPVGGLTRAHLEQTFARIDASYLFVGHMDSYLESAEKIASLFGETYHDGQSHNEAPASAKTDTQSLINPADLEKLCVFDRELEAYIKEKFLSANAN